jgi:hypothetical protein
VVLGALCSLWPVHHALAYRPFDSTDADVARAGEVELEIEPLGYLQEGQNRYLVSPATVVNFGVAGEREIVLEGQVREARNSPPDVPATSLVATGLSLKQVLHEGSLQDQPGPSVATEYGLLPPTVNAESGMGANLTGVVSQRWAAGTVHLNGELILNREHRRETFWGVIGEAPYSWPIRPVAEIFVQHEEAGLHTESGLVGAIWRFRQNLSFDIGFREARIDDEKAREWRLGFTWGIPYRR